ncbi:MAG: Hsp20/alpha crystallin family protein [Thermoguttaceae bacterium]
MLPGTSPPQFACHHFIAAFSGQFGSEDKSGNAYHFRQERLYRMVALPHGVEVDKIEARYHNGVPEVHIPKGEEAKGKRITVKST